jgi:hypothetical protein
VGGLLGGNSTVTVEGGARAGVVAVLDCATETVMLYALVDCLPPSFSFFALLVPLLGTGKKEVYRCNVSVNFDR